MDQICSCVCGGSKHEIPFYIFFALLHLYRRCTVCAGEYVAVSGLQRDLVLALCLQQKLVFYLYSAVAALPASSLAGWLCLWLDG